MGITSIEYSGWQSDVNGPQGEILRRPNSEEAKSEISNPKSERIPKSKNSK
jgi:hypothetical protein